jgi:hypothetical protein
MYIHYGRKKKFFKTCSFSSVGAEKRVTMILLLKFHCMNMVAQTTFTETLKMQVIPYPDFKRFTDCYILDLRTFLRTFL